MFNWKSNFTCTKIFNPSNFGSCSIICRLIAKIFLIKWVGIFLIFSSGLCSWSWAATSRVIDDSFFAELSTPNIEILPKAHLESYPLFVFSPYKLVALRWSPDWNEALLPEDCSREAIELSRAANTIGELWRKCEPKIRLAEGNQIHETLSMLSYDFDLLTHPLSREVVFHLPQQLNIRGILLVRNLEPRPLVIVRTGIFSSFNSMVAERFVMSQLFERGDFNLLVIPSTTGRQFIEDNERYIFGGFEEGLHTLWIARELKKANQPLSKLIPEIHTVGVSMGANGVLAANLLNAVSKKSWLQKSIYFCPLMDFNSTLRNIKEINLTSIMTSLWTGMRLEPLRKKYKISMLEFFDYAAFVEHLTQNYSEPLMGWDDELLPASAKNIKLNTALFGASGSLKNEQFVKFNDFEAWLSYSSLTNPSLIFYSLFDTLVPPSSNILSVASKLPPNNEILPMTRGYHCAVPVNYNEAFMANLVNTFFKPIKQRVVLWQKELNYNFANQGQVTEPVNLKITDLRITDLKITDLKVLPNQNLVITFRNSAIFSIWTEDIEVPRSVIDMYFDSSIWNHPLKQSIRKWLEAHMRILKSNRNGINYGNNNGSDPRAVLQILN